MSTSSLTSMAFAASVNKSNSEDFNDDYSCDNLLGDYLCSLKLTAFEPGPYKAIFNNKDLRPLSRKTAPHYHDEGRHQKSRTHPVAPSCTKSVN